MNALSTL